MTGRQRVAVPPLRRNSGPVRAPIALLLTPVVLLLAAAGCAETAQDASAPPAAPPPAPEAVYLTSETTASMNLPFSDAVRVGHLLFLSGQIGNIPGTTDLASGGIQGEARQTMENIKAVLEANGSSMDRVIKATVMLADIAEWPAFNEVYVTYFPGDKPARSAFAGSGLAWPSARGAKSRSDRHGGRLRLVLACMFSWNPVQETGCPDWKTRLTAWRPRLMKCAVI